jgi:outer membrane receptor protein involved in Fe transport
LGLFGSAGIGFRDYLFVTVTGRNDFSSTLITKQADGSYYDNNYSFFYPSLSASFIVSEAFKLTSESINLIKIRGGVAKVGNSTDPYNLLDVADINPLFGSDPRQTISQTKRNIGLKAELTDSWEIGLETKLFKNRVGFDISYYNNVSKNQILNARVSRTSGYESALINAGKITNSGLEVTLNLVPVKVKDFQWDVDVNYAYNYSKVVELDGQLQTFVMNTYWGLTNEARVGDRFGALYGFGPLKNNDGKYIVDADGLIQSDPNKKVLGYSTPKYTAGLRNTFSYKFISLSALIDTKQGNSVFSVTNTWGNYAGTLASTLDGREDGIVVENSVKADGTPNDKVVTAEEYYKSKYVNSLHEPSVYDASFVKLREVVLGFNLPDKLFGKTSVKGASISLVGRNLWIISKKTPNIDPETAFGTTNGQQGLEFGQIPSTRSIGVNINFSF